MNTEGSPWEAARVQGERTLVTTTLRVYRQDIRGAAKSLGLAEPEDLFALMERLGLHQEATAARDTLCAGDAAIAAREAQRSTDRRGLLALLEAHGWNMVAVAKALDLGSPATVRNRAERLGLHAEIVEARIKGMNVRGARGRPKRQSASDT